MARSNKKKAEADADERVEKFLAARTEKKRSINETICVTGCRTCPLYRDSALLCLHPKAPDSFEQARTDRNTVRESRAPWCPLTTHPVTVLMRKDK